MTRLTAVSSLVSSVLLGSALLLAPSVAHAQDPGPTPVNTTGAAGGTDHSQVVGTFGVGYLGLQSINIGDTRSIPVQAPVIGMRYWLNEGMGIDVGLGLGFSGGSQKDANSESTDKPSVFGIAVHGGVPLALATGKHHTFQVVPELNIGYASASQDVGGTNNKATGFLLGLGARAGSEIHFGFIGLPRLSLQATVGLNFSYSKGTSKSGDNAETSDSGYGLGTTVQQSPWAIFTNNISALYYF